MQKTNEPFGTPDADGWYEWNGDDTARPAGHVEVFTRAGQPWFAYAPSMQWRHLGMGSDIVKWRPAR